MTEIPVIRKVEKELNKQLLRDFKGERTSFVQVGTEKWFLPIKYEKFAEEFSNFEVRSDDTWLITYPRSGTTVISELVWLIANEVDFTTASRIVLPNRVPFLELNLVIHDEVAEEIHIENNPQGREYSNLKIIPEWERLKTMPSPRFIKTHLPFQLLPKNLLTCGAKVIYIARNPKDVAVSCYQLYRTMKYQDFKGNFEQFWDYFERDLIIWSPYWDHVIGGWNQRNNPNVHFIFYEEYCKNSSEVMLNLAKYLNKTLTDEDIVKLTDHLKFDNFKKNSSVNHEHLQNFNALHNTGQGFIRKGKVGGWVDEFIPELSARADEWIEKNLKKTDLRFPL